LLSDPSFFPEEAAIDAPASIDHLKIMIERWKSYVDQGIFRLSVPIDTPLGGTKDSKAAEFWTTSKPYWNMEHLSPETFDFLKRSDLVIFKGDLKQVAVFFTAYNADW